MRDNWDIAISRQTKRQRARGPYVSLNKRGEIAMNDQAFKLIRCPYNVALAASGPGVVFTYPELSPESRSSAMSRYRVASAIARATVLGRLPGRMSRRAQYGRQAVRGNTKDL